MHQTPDRISEKVLSRRLDSQTAFEIVSIDIADIDVGENIGARLQAEQAEADTRVSRAKAEGRRAMAVAQEQENIARSRKARQARGGRGRSAQGDRRGLPQRHPGHPRLLQASQRPGRYRHRGAIAHSGLGTVKGGPAAWIALAWPLVQGGHLVGTLLGSAIVIISTIVQVINKSREAKRLAERNRPRDAAQPPNSQPPNPQPPNLQLPNLQRPNPQAPEETRPPGDEIEEFLKRAAQRRQAAAQLCIAGSGAPSPRSCSRPVDVEAPTRRLVHTPAVELSTQQPAQLIPLEGQPESVAAHVRDLALRGQVHHRDPGPRQGSDRSRPGGLQRHLHDTFDQRVGRLYGHGRRKRHGAGRPWTWTPRRKPTPRRQRAFAGSWPSWPIPACSARPSSSREIFSRPEGRWE